MDVHMPSSTGLVLFCLSLSEVPYSWWATRCLLSVDWWTVSVCALWSILWLTWQWPNVRTLTGWPLVGNSGKCQGIYQMSGKKSCRGKLSIVYFTFGTVSVFNRLLWALCHPLTDLSACFILNIFAVTVYPTGSTDKNMCLKWIRHFW